MSNGILDDPRRVNPYQSHLLSEFTYEAKTWRKRKKHNIHAALEEALSTSAYNLFRDNDHVLFMRPEQ